MKNNLISFFRPGILIMGIAAAMLGTSGSRAEMIILKSGEKIDGKILTHTDEKITVDVGQGIDVTYYRDEVETIDGVAVSSASFSSAGASSVGVTPEPSLQTEHAQTAHLSEPAQQRAGQQQPEPPMDNVSTPANTTAGTALQNFFAAAVDSQSQSSQPSSQNKTLPSASLTESTVEKKTTPPQTLSQEHIPPSPAQKEDKDKSLPKTKISDDAGIASSVETSQQAFRRASKVFKKDFPEVYRMLRKLFKNTNVSSVKGRLHSVSNVVNPFFEYGVSAPVILILVGLYAAMCFPMMMIADRIGLKPESWMAFIPIFQIILFFRMADRPLWWFIFLLIPVVNIFVYIVLWANVCEFLQRSSLIAVLMVIPVVNVFALWYLAIVPTRQAA